MDTRADEYLAHCARVGIDPGPTRQEYASAWAALWRAFELMYWDDRARTYWGNR